MPFEEGVIREGEIFRECLSSPQSAALIHIFFGERAVSKVPDIPKDTPVKEIKSAGIIGAGTMGGGIAMVYANAGIPVLLKEAKQEFLDRGMGIIEKNYGARVKKGKLTQEKMDERVGLIKPVLSYDGFEDVDIVGCVDTTPDSPCPTQDPGPDGRGGSDRRCPGNLGPGSGGGPEIELDAPAVIDEMCAMIDCGQSWAELYFSSTLQSEKLNAPAESLK